MHDYKRAQAITIPRQTVLQHDAWRLRAQTFLTKSAAYFGFILVAIGELFQILCILHFVRLLLLHKDSYKRTSTRQDGQIGVLLGHTCPTFCGTLPGCITTIFSAAKLR